MPFSRAIVLAMSRSDLESCNVSFTKLSSFEYIIFVLLYPYYEYLSITFSKFVYLFRDKLEKCNIIVLMKDAYKFWRNVDFACKDKSLADLSKITGISYSTIRNQRSINRMPQLYDAYLIAKALNVSVESLITGKEDSTYLSPEALEVQKDKNLQSVVNAILINKEVIPSVIAFISSLNQELDRKNIDNQKNEASSKIS